ncbi:hypothetical protein [Pseudomonas sp. ICMP 460]|uniref:hypothetical protein n=1 Tax=Pseudomonas sp. ICMP 460 TaxID=1718917 RepID=UPI000C06F46D|nr:hypothetical protein [Pseudomonas sp. ICMP 460]PHN29448.1 hypothetical protein AO240_20700 [Pseudomonas sp. ICMP 460]
MTKITESPSTQTVEIINEAHFEKFEDAALLLMSFEKLADAVEAVSEGGEIHERDDTHVGLMEACMALAIMFRRRTGHDAQKVSADHLDQERQCLMGGVEIKSLPIPLRPTPCGPLPKTAFHGIPDLSLAWAGFNYVSRVLEHIKGNSPHLVELDMARAHSLDAMNALSLLIESLTGATPGGTPDDMTKANAPGPETLQ